MKFGRPFWSRVQKSNGCWLWTGAKSRGYGVVIARGRRWKAHHFALLDALGQDVPAGMVVMHTCDNRACVRPDHLRVATQSDNIKDMWQKERRARPYDGATHCSRGHEYTPDNTRRDNRGHRVCRECRRTDALARYHRTKKLKRARST